MLSGYEITELWRYPVKSMGGESLDRVDVGPGGVEGDRRWALRNTETNKIISAKRPRPYGKLLEWSARTDGGGVVVTSPDGDEHVAGDPELDEALTTSFSEPIRLVEVVQGDEETYDSEWPEIPGTALSETEMELQIAMLTEKLSFVDLSALHIVLKESMDHLSTLVDGASVAVERFRPNLVVSSGDGSGSGEFSDLAWKDVPATAGSAGLFVAEAAPRCVMTTLAQGRYERAKAILGALAAHAKKETDFGVYACFGTYAEVTQPGSIAVGDRFALGA